MTQPNTVPRVAAKLVDLLLVIAIAAVLPRVVGPLLGFAYSMLADGLRFKLPGLGARGVFSGQSLGKKIFGLQVIHSKTRETGDFRDSAIRNTPVGLATFFAIIPIWGWIILFMIGVPMMIIEVYLIARVERGHRLGDVMADTEVILAQASEIRSKSEQKRSKTDSGL